MSRLFTAVHAAAARRPGLRRALSRAARFVPDRTIERDVPHAGRLAFGLRRHRWLLGRTPFEGHRPVLRLFQRQIKDGDVLYDVGANIGYYARFALARFRVSQIVAFEPMAANVGLLRRNAELAGGGKIDVRPIALGDADEAAVELQVDDQADGSAVLSKISGGRAAEGRAAQGLSPLSERVELVKLDTLLAREPDLPRPDVMKIDTEGAEHLVLEGARETLANHRPRLILAAHGTARARQMLELLADLGYHAAGWHPDGRWGPLTPADAETLGDNNCIASPDEADVAGEPEPIEL